MSEVNQIFIYPTDTVWGIGANIFSESAQLEIAKIKQTESGKPLSVLFSSYSQLEDYVDLPIVEDIDWKTFFSLESTLLIPSEHFETLPKWINYDSPFVGIRLLENEAMSKIHHLCDKPITTTSLNLHGNDPILKLEEAVEFMYEHCPHAILIDDLSLAPSGQASTILKFNGLEFTFLREGTKIEEIKNAIGI